MFVMTPSRSASAPRKRLISRSINSLDEPGAIPTGALSACVSLGFKVGTVGTPTPPSPATSNPGNNHRSTCLSIAASGAPPRRSMSFSASTVLSRSAKSVWTTRNLVSNTEGDALSGVFSLVCFGRVANPRASKCLIRRDASNATFFISSSADSSRECLPTLV